MGGRGGGNNPAHFSIFECVTSMWPFLVFGLSLEYILKEHNAQRARFITEFYLANRMRYARN